MVAIMIKLSSENVTATVISCLFNDGEDTKAAVIVNGIMKNIGFNPLKLQDNKENIIDMLMQLPIVFRESSGGGMTFLNACQDIDNDQWTGDQSIMEDLFLLGIAIGKVEWLLPKEFWKTLPGGVPYVVIKDK